ncbi:unnamed protein product, partial [Nesidiocoris tenuis]
MRENLSNIFVFWKFHSVPTARGLGERLNICDSSKTHPCLVIIIEEDRPTSQSLHFSIFTRTFLLPCTP